jgi:phenylacetate-coenzyme A ligase PaaK-like adenylate-forming protein
LSSAIRVPISLPVAETPRANMYPNAIEAVVRERESEYRIVVDRGRYMDELVVEVERPDGMSPDASALRRTRLQPRFKEVLMVRTVVRVIEPSIYDVQMFKARRVSDRPSL